MDMSTNSKFILVKWEGVRTEEGLGSHVIKDLSRYLVGKDHVIYIDNFFSSPALFESLYALVTAKSKQNHNKHLYHFLDFLQVEYCILF
jgi:hypothetical protein